MGNQITRILFAHSGGEQGGPGKGSYDFISHIRSWLPAGVEMRAPVIDEPEAPTYGMWEELFDREMNPREDPLILIGHSLGGSMLVKYLSERSDHPPVSALFLVAAPHWGEDGWEVPAFTLQDGFERHLHGIQKVFIYHSVDDPVVPFYHAEFYQACFGNPLLRPIPGDDHAFPKGIPGFDADLASQLAI